jgi:hypothetical protein
LLPLYCFLPSFIPFQEGYFSVHPQ